ncbi:MAG: glycosyltransferase family 2 protein [Deltaproteobacteria bacterium]|nr:glycosyltransferase family 2 protein [Deltaproteobacteria bacterium]
MNPEASPAIKLSIVLINYNKPALTLACVESIIGSGFDRFNVFIIDNGSGPGDQDFFSEKSVSMGIRFHPYKPDITSIEFNRDIYWYDSPDNLGYAGGMNLGFRFAKTRKPDFISFLNNDTLLPGNFFDDMFREIKVVSMNEDFGMAGCLIRNMDDRSIWFAGGELDLKRCMGRHLNAPIINHQIHETHFLTGCFNLFKPDTYEALGEMDGDFFLYFEDFDLCYRMLNKGLKLYITPNVELTHQAGSSTGGDESLIGVYYPTRNRLWLMRKHFRGYRLWRFYLFFFPTRMIKALKWILSGKISLVLVLLKGLKDGLFSKKNKGLRLDQ